MIKLLHFRLLFVMLISAQFLIPQYTYAQAAITDVSKDTLDDNFDIRNASFLLPQPLPKGKYYQNISILYVVVPKDWTTETINAPMLYYAGKYTLPYGFNVQASVATLLISYRFNAGPFWNYTIGRYHLGAGYQIAFNYGFLNQFGFNTKLTIWEQQPSIAAGYSFKKSAVTLRGDLYWTNSIYQRQGGHTIAYTTSFINGYSITGALEQRLWKNNVMVFGVKMNYLRYHIIAWPAYPVNQYRYWVPEFHVGLNF